MPVAAAVLRKIGAPLTVEDIELAPTGADQVRVRLMASGVCHSDFSIARGALPHPTPVVLGHEGAGVVTEVGSNVTHVSPGDHVVLNWTPACRECFFCARGEAHLCERAIQDTLTMPYATLGGETLWSTLGTSTWASETLALGRAAIPIDQDIPFEVAALVGCAVTTGVGAALNTAKVAPGSAVVVLGCGGVGLSVLMGARYAGAATIIAVDLNADKLRLATSLGATHTVLASDDVAAAVRDLTTGHGADYVFEVIGRPATIAQAAALTRRGGTTVVVGAGGADQTVSFTPFELFYQARTIVGCFYGSSDPERDFPRLLALYRQGALDLDRLVSAKVGLDGINAALERMAAGEGARTVLVPAGA